MNKQIEDMRGDLIEIFDKEYDERRLITPHNTAEKLTALGYRRAADVARKVIKEVEQILTVKIIGIEEDLFHGTAAHWDGIRRECYEEMLVELSELKKKYESKGAE